MFGTITTTGYGDFIPSSIAGQLVAVTAMITGIMMLALPITVIGSNFTNEYDKDEKHKTQFKKELSRRKSVSIDGLTRRKSVSLDGRPKKPAGYFAD